MDFFVVVLRTLIALFIWAIILNEWNKNEEYIRRAFIYTWDIERVNNADVHSSFLTEKGMKSWRRYSRYRRLMMWLRSRRIRNLLKRTKLAMKIERKPFNES